LQDQIAVLLSNERAPPKYLALYVGDVRLTESDFPFVDQLDLKDQAKVVKYLQSARSVSAMYDTDVNNAEASLKARGLFVEVVKAGNKVCLEVEGKENNTMKVLALPELGTWSIHYRVDSLRCWHTANTLGDFSCFPFLRNLEMHHPSSIKEANLKSLVACKLLKVLELTLKGCSSTLDGVGDLVNLKRIKIVVVSDDEACNERFTIPTDVGKLSKLVGLYFSGLNVSGRIPTEIGLLTKLEVLDFRGTSLSGVIPSELCLLTSLRFCTLIGNRNLRGTLHLPGQYINTDGTPHVHHIQ
jgi:hypothetical protein